jgi:hypothetical protein
MPAFVITDHIYRTIRAFVEDFEDKSFPKILSLAASYTTVPIRFNEIALVISHGPSVGRTVTETEIRARLALALDEFRRFDEAFSDLADDELLRLFFAWCEALTEGERIELFGEWTEYDVLIMTL